MKLPAPVHIIMTPDGVGADVYLDGVKVQNVRKVTLGAVTATSAVLTLELVGVPVVVEGDVAPAAKAAPKASKDQAP